MDRQTDKVEQTDKKNRFTVFILAITFDMNYKMNQIYIMYMYLIIVIFIHFEQFTHWQVDPI